jgi:hypothetical protein
MVRGYLIQLTDRVSSVRVMKVWPGPWELAWFEEEPSRGKAMIREIQI